MLMEKEVKRTEIESIIFNNSDSVADLSEREGERAQADPRDCHPLSHLI